MKKKSRLLYIYIFISIIFLSGMLLAKVDKSEAEIDNAGNSVVRLHINSYASKDYSFDRGGYYLQRNYYFPYNSLGKDNKEVISNIVSQFYNNSIDPKNIEPINGMKFKIYVINSKDVFDEFTKNPQNYSTPESVENYIKEHTKNDYSGKFGYIEKGSNGENIISDVNNETDMDKMLKSFNNPESAQNITTNSDGQAVFNYSISNKSDGGLKYFWIVEDINNNKESKKIDEISSQPLAFAYNRPEIYEKGESNTYDAYLYAKNDYDEAICDCNIDLAKTSEKNNSQEYLLKFDGKKYISKDISICNDYVNWVIDIECSMKKLGNVDSINISEEVDSNFRFIDDSYDNDLKISAYDPDKQDKSNESNELENISELDYEYNTNDIKNKALIKIDAKKIAKDYRFKGFKNIHLRINLGTKLISEYDEGYDVKNENKNDCENRCTVELEKEGNKKVEIAKKNDQNPRVHFGNLGVKVYDAKKKDKEIFVGKFILYRKITVGKTYKYEYYNLRKFVPVDKEKHFNFMKNDEENPEFIYGRGDYVAKVQGVDNTSYMLEEQKNNSLKEKNEPIQKDFSIEYFLREVDAPIGYKMIYTGNEIEDEILEDSNSLNDFAIKPDKRDIKVYIADNVDKYSEGDRENLANHSLERQKNNDIIYPKRFGEDPNVKYLLQVYNTKKILPKVGGQGIIFIIVSGLVLISFSLYVLIKRKRKEYIERNTNNNSIK